MSNKKHTLQDSIDELRAIREAQTEERYYNIDTTKKLIDQIEEMITTVNSLEYSDEQRIRLKNNIIKNLNIANCDLEILSKLGI